MMVCGKAFHKYWPMQILISIQEQMCSILKESGTHAEALKTRIGLVLGGTAY